MQLPETQNAHHVHAFKKGYRLALEGKPLTNMPSAFRYDRTLRVYYEQGWAQAMEEIEAGYQDSLNPPWHNRVAWFIVIIIGSVVTAVGLITGIKQEQAEQQARILGTQTQQPALQQPVQVIKPVSENVTKPPFDKQIETTENMTHSPVESSQTIQIPPRELALDEAYSSQNDSDSYQPTLSLIEPQAIDSPQSEPSTAEVAIKPTNNSEKPGTLMPVNELSLLTREQRADLVLNKQEFIPPKRKLIEPQALVDSDILIESAILTTGIQNKQATDTLGNRIPKQIRTLYFFTQLKGAEKQTVYHRWIYKNQEMALIPLKINSNLYRTWSSKRMASAWQGEWMVEILNSKKEVIYRQTFQYGNG